MTMNRRNFLKAGIALPFIPRSPLARASLLTSSGNIVAAVNASQWFKDRADYQCDGINDEVELLRASATCPKVILSDGTFYTDVTTLFPANRQFHGQKGLTTWKPRGSRICNLNDGQGFHDITFDGALAPRQYGIHNPWGGHKLRASGNTFRNFSLSAIYARNSNGSIVADNDFENILGSGGEAAIHFRDSWNCKALNNRNTSPATSQAALAIMLDYVYDCEVEGNRSNGCYSGCQVRNGSGHNIHDNWFNTPYGYGIDVNLDGGWVKVNHNRIVNPVLERGITIYTYPDGFVNDSEVIGNTVIGAPLSGIYVRGFRNQVSMNRVADCPITEGGGADWNIFALNIMSGARGIIVVIGPNSRLV